MARFYSRLSRVEEKRNIKKAVIYLVLTLLLFVLLITYGLPTFARFASFLTNLRSSNAPIEKNDITPPAPPQVDTPPEFTNRDRVEIRGTTEAGATIIVTANDTTEELIANRDGIFTYNFAVRRGANSISFKAKDTAGNEGQTTPLYPITFDDEPPSIEITTPKDGESFYGSKQRQIVIEGKVDEADNLNINGRTVAIESDGSFTYAISLQEGENNFEIKAQDAAGNEIVERLTVSYWK